MAMARVAGDATEVLMVLLLDFPKVPRRHDRLPCLQARLLFESRLSTGRWLLKGLLQLLVKVDCHQHEMEE